MEHESNPEIIRSECGQRTCRATVHNGIVYLGGQVARVNAGGTVVEQTREALAAGDIWRVEGSQRPIL